MNPREIFDLISAIRGGFDHANAASEGDGWGHAGLGADVVGVAAQLIPRAGKTPIIGAALSAMAYQSWLCGVGLSSGAEKGEGFSEGARSFNDIKDTVGSATPDASWVGSASSAYAARNTVHQDDAEAVASTDRNIKITIAKQENELSGTRDQQDKAATVLGYSILPALAARAIPIVGPEMALGIEIGAVAATLPVCNFATVSMATKAIDNANRIHDLMMNYHQIASRQRKSQ